MPATEMAKVPAKCAALLSCFAIVATMTAPVRRRLGAPIASTSSTPCTTSRSRAAWKKTSLPGSATRRASRSAPSPELPRASASRSDTKALSSLRPTRPRASGRRLRLAATPTSAASPAPPPRSASPSPQKEGSSSPPIPPAASPPGARRAPRRRATSSRSPALRRPSAPPAMPAPTSSPRPTRPGARAPGPQRTWSPLRPKAPAPALRGQRALRGLLCLHLTLRPGRRQKPHLHRHRSVRGGFSLDPPVAQARPAATADGPRLRRGFLEGQRHPPPARPRVEHPRR